MYVDPEALHDILFPTLCRREVGSALILRMRAWLFREARRIHIIRVELERIVARKRPKVRPRRVDAHTDGTFARFHVE
jgi:hypothetical protein